MIRSRNTANESSKISRTVGKRTFVIHRSKRGAKAVSGYDGVRDGWIRHRTVELTREIERLAVSRQLCKLTRRLRGFLIFSHDVLIEPASTPLGELS